MPTPGSLLTLAQYSATPSPPPSGFVELYIESDALTMQDEFGHIFVFGATTAITALTGDVSAVGPGSAAATVNLVGGQTAAAVASTVVEVGNATSSPTPSTLVYRDSSGDFQAVNFSATGTIMATGTVTGSNLSGTNTGDVTVVDTNSIDLAFTSGQTGLSASLNISAASPDAGYIFATAVVKSDGLLVEGLAATPVQIATTNNIGSANAFSRSDHVHAHGAQSDPTLHAIATDSANGFMSSADKTKLDAVVTAGATDAQILISNGTTFNPYSVTGDVSITDAGVTAIASTVVTGKLLTGYAVGSNTAIAATDSILIAFEKVQGQINATVGAAITALTGDGTATGPGSVAFTLATVNSSVGTFGSSTSIPTFTVNGKGLITAASGNAVVAPAGTLTGATLNSTVVNSSLQNLGVQNALLNMGGNYVGNISQLAIGEAAPAAATAIDIVNTTGLTQRIVQTGYGGTVGTRNRYANGTLVSPTAATVGQILGFISAQGYGTSAFPSSSTGSLNFIAGETFTNASNLTYVTVNTTPTGSITAAEALRVASTGVTLGPQSASTAIHQFNGGQSGTVKTITTSTYAVDSTTTDYLIYTDSTSNAIAITLPAPTAGRTLVIEDKTAKAFANNITVNPHASETINGSSSFVISQNYGSIRITSDGVNWFVTSTTPNIAATIIPVNAISASAIDWSTANVFTKTLGANTTFTFANQTAGQTIIVRLTNTASNYTVTWPTVRWPAATAPTMSTGAVSDVYTFVYDGSNTYGSYVQNMS